MFRPSILDLRQTGSPGALVSDYISARPATRPFYAHRPAPEGFSEFLSKTPYKSIDRNTLVKALLAQAAGSANAREASLGNIRALAEDRTFTVTTGHQLCLFTGPLYFIYKICTTIRLARELSRHHSLHRFVPVFWLASEDHDFAEVNHFNLPGKTVRWDSKQSGAVGRFTTAELKALLPEVKKLFGSSANGKWLTGLFSDAYLGQKNLADATRFLVNELFGEYGVIVVDGDDPALKPLFAPEMKKDLVEGLTHRLVAQTVAELKHENYGIQVTPREVNLFLLDESARHRIDRTPDGYVAGGKTFSEKEILTLLQKSPERFSPNVSLRGLYQQKILPNLAYIGGPGELSYWLEYKRMFDGYGVPFPILVPRNSFTVLNADHLAKLERLGIGVSELFRPFDELVRKRLSETGQEVSADAEKKTLAQVYDQLRKKVEAVDQGLLKYTAAQEHRHLAGVDKIVEKLNRSLRRRSETELQRIRTAQQIVLPDQHPQERHYNFALFALIYGPDFISEILRHADPFEYRHIVLEKT